MSQVDTNAATQCMAKYDLDGWTVPDLLNADDVNIITKSRHRGGASIGQDSTSVPEPWEKRR